MTRIGFHPGPTFSHVQSMLCLALELKHRGYDIVFFGIPDANEYLAKYTDIPKVNYGEEERPLGSNARILNHIAGLSNLAALRYGFTQVSSASDITLRRAPAIFKKQQVDVLVGDEMNAVVDWTLAQHLNVPYVTMACAPVMVPDSQAPSAMSGRQYSSSWLSGIRTRIENRFFSMMMLQQSRVVERSRAEWGLEPLGIWHSRTTILRHITVLAQGVHSFDYPRSDPAPTMHSIGRWANRDGSDPLAKDIAFPYERLDATKKMVYVSFGTALTQHQDTLVKVARAVLARTDVQLVLTLGKKDGSVSPALQELVDEGNSVVVPFAPQAILVPKAAAFVTHAGMNSSMMALAHGIPTLCIPISLDQPGVAARIAAAGAGVVVPLSNVTQENVTVALGQVLDDRRFKKNAMEIAQEFRKAGGVVRAADIVDKVVEKGRAISRDDVE